MKTIQIHLYELDELDAEARAKALGHYRDLNTQFDWYDFLLDDFAGICGTLGISVDTKQINFSGFYSQGDGSAFKATANIPKLAKAIDTQAWKDYAPKLEFNFPRCPADPRILRLMKNETLDVSPQIYQPNRGYYVSADLNEQLPWYNNHRYDNIQAQLDITEAWFLSVAKLLNHYLYRTLQEEYEYQTDDEQVAEAIKANDYHFTVDGKSANRIEQLAETINT